MLAPLALAAALLQLPAAALQAGGRPVPLTISSWCVGLRCGAPITASSDAAVVRRGGIVRCVFGFEPGRVTISVGGRAVEATGTGDERAWRAVRGGGVTITASAPSASSPQLWVTYVGRLVVR